MQNMKNILKAGVVLISGVAMLIGATSLQAATYRVGIVTFLSGGAAGPFGVPARNAAEMVIAALNAGKVPGYGTKGIAGTTIEPVIIDEGGAVTQRVANYRKLVQRQNVDVVVGFISSGSCLAVAPVAEELKKLTIFFDCGTPRIFEEGSYKYVFRTAATATMDSVGAARYVLSRNKNAAKVAGINQNYAWGQDSWSDFIAAMQKLQGGTSVTTKQFPKIYAGQYGAEISALLTSRSDVIHSSFWGGDMEAFVLQGGARGLFQQAQVILTTGETATYRLGAQMPDGTIIGARGPYGVLAPKSALNDWFRKEYFNRYGTWPTYPSYHMAQALLGLKTAAEKAGGVSSQDAIISALEGLEFQGPGGTIRMDNANGHQAVTPTAYGTYKFDKSTGQPSIVNVVNYPASCVNPPNGVKAQDWIKSGFKGAQCN